jgi:hypothetical protein
MSAHCLLLWTEWSQGQAICAGDAKQGHSLDTHASKSTSSHHNLLHISTITQNLNQHEQFSPSNPSTKHKRILETIAMAAISSPKHSPVRGVVHSCCLG